MSKTFLGHLVQWQSDRVTVWQGDRVRVWEGERIIVREYDRMPVCQGERVRVWGQVLLSTTRGWRDAVGGRTSDLCPAAPQRSPVSPVRSSQPPLEAAPHILVTDISEEAPPPWRPFYLVLFGETDIVTTMTGRLSYCPSSTCVQLQILTKGTMQL